MASPKPSVPEAFRKTVEFLENEQVPFVVVGGLAASLQGEPRYTDDADFMITLSTTDVYRFAERAKAEGFDIEPDLAETQWRGSGFVRLWLGPAGRQTAVDLMACNSDFLREVAWRAHQVRCLGCEVPVATPEDMLLLKISAWRPKDIPDAVAIVDRHSDGLDVAYLNRWAEWFVSKNPFFKEMSARLKALLDAGPLPPPASGPF